MSKHNKYILISWYWDTSSDYESNHRFETDFHFVTDKQLSDITQLMKEYDIKNWIKDPETITADNYNYGDGSLIEFRNLTVRPVKIVESWSYTSEVGK